MTSPDRRAPSAIQVSTLAAYAIAGGLSAASVAVRLGLEPVFGQRLRFILFIPAIMASGWFGGFAPGLFATIVCGLGAIYFWSEPRNTWGVNDPVDILGFAVFLAVGILVSVLNETWRRRAARLLVSDGQWRATLRGIGDAVIAVDAAGKLSAMNGVAELLTGWSQADAIGLPLAEVFRVGDHPQGGPIPTGQSSSTPRMQRMLSSRDGRQVPIEVLVAPIRASDSTTNGEVFVFRDVSERARREAERVERQLEERAARNAAEAYARQLQLALEAGRLGIWELILATGELRWLAGAEPIHRFASGATAGTFEQFVQEVHPEDRARKRAAIDAAIQTQREYRTEYRVVRADGSVRWVESRGQLFVDPQGRPHRLVAVRADVTERRSVEAARAALLLQEQEASRRKDEFLAVLSHELRNPLAPLRNAVDILSTSRDDPYATQRAQEVIERQLGHLVRLVDDLLDLSRVDQDRLELRRERVALSTPLDAALEASRPLMTARRHRLEARMPTEALWVEADPVRLAQVFTNILNNAANYTAEGGRIEVWAETVAGAHRVHVRDNGVGMTPKTIERLFDMFYRDEQAARSAGGLGIGLALAKRIVDLHGGTLDAGSAGPGTGSELVVTLPAVEAPAEAAEPAARVAPRVVRRVLVTDDNADAAETLAMLLRIEGHDVRSVHDGFAACALVPEFRPDVVLLDIGMPGIDGYETARRIRKMPEGGDVELVALTGWGQEEDRRRAEEAGFSTHLTKPVDPQLLRRLISAVPVSTSRT